MRHVFGANGKNLEKERSSWEKMGSRAQVKQQEGCPLSKGRKKKYGCVGEPLTETACAGQAP